jgi:hypothetical protein
LGALLLHGKVYSAGFVYDKSGGALMCLTDLAIAVRCLNRLNFKIGDYTCKVERTDAGGSPTWELV